MVFDTLLFVCAICQREIRDWRGRNGRDRQMAPVCRYCEEVYAETRPKAGAFMDRRKATQISALANALNAKAHAQQWEARYGRA